MIPNLYLTELFTWLKTNTIWSTYQKFQLVLWLLAFIYTTIAIITISIASLIGPESYWLVAGLYVLNYPALWLFQPNVVKNHKLRWKRDYDCPY